MAAQAECKSASMWDEIPHKVHEYRGLRIVIYSYDHRLAHVHVIGNGHEATFKLNCPNGPTQLDESYGFSKKEFAQIAAELATVLSSLCAKWRDIHGNH